MNCSKRKLSIASLECHEAVCTLSLFVVLAVIFPSRPNKTIKLSSWQIDRTYYSIIQPVLSVDITKYQVAEN